VIKQKGGIVKFTKLFEPCKIGKLELANRIVMPPMTTNFAKEGLATDCMVDYYAERGRGGVGLIVVEDAIVDTPVGNHTLYCLHIDDDRYLPGLRRISQAVKAEGTKVILNLNHGGRRAGRVENGQLLVTKGKIPVAPSPLPHPVTGYVVPRELSIEEIEELEDKFVQAAYRVKEAGFDGLSLHAAHMYLISEFLSPLSNRRKDIYGGDVNNRLRFPVNIIHKIRRKLGNDFPIMVRINGREGLEGGITIEGAKEIARGLEAAGVDTISLSCGAGTMLAIRNFPTPVAPVRLPHGLEVNLATAVKQVVSVPVMTANRIVTPQEAEDILEQGRADLIGIGRGLIADPEWPKKAKKGREDEIRFCIGCMHCFKKVLEDRDDMRCSVNSAAGQEAECKITPAAKSKVVFVAGGGPAGLETARVAALRRHKVRLFEKEKVGGQLNLACIPPGKNDIRFFLDFQEKQLSKLKIKIENKELTPEIVKQEKPDVVIAANGAQPLLPSLPGIEGKNVVTAWQVLKGGKTTGNKVVILGGGMVGAETAEYLAAKGKQVTIVEMLEAIAADMDRTSRLLLIFSLDELGVKMLTKATAKEINDQGVIVNHRSKQQFIKVDTVVLALGARPNRELADHLKMLGTELYLVGDCAQARKLPDAVEEGFKTALKL
jgi:2,4-dienoyl-CoA reductase-like NADH-dependent reductase (Old Yellow Enzyme family)/thioredoxin reductase